MHAVKCDSCGGAIASRIGAPEPICLFCGSTALTPTDPPEHAEQPAAWLPFEADRSTAETAFRSFASSSFWYPAAIRSTRIELRQLLLPAWIWSGHLETHYTGLVAARTQSGKRPVSGEHAHTFDQVLVPASPTLTVRELAGLGVWNEHGLQEWPSAESAVPHELSELTRSAAEGAAAAEMQHRHGEMLTSANSLQKIRVASLPSDLQGRPVLVPVWIGVYRHREVPYRVLVNGQDGTLVGEAPTDWLKVAAVALATGLAIAALFSAVAMALG